MLCLFYMLSVAGCLSLFRGSGEGWWGQGRTGRNTSSTLFRRQTFEKALKQFSIFVRGGPSMPFRVPGWTGIVLPDGVGHSLQPATASHTKHWHSSLSVAWNNLLKTCGYSLSPKLSSPHIPSFSHCPNMPACHHALPSLPALSCFFHIKNKAFSFLPATCPSLSSLSASVQIEHVL